MPDSKNKDWPEVELERHGEIGPCIAGSFRHNVSPGDGREFETYVPLQGIRERLLSDEAVEAAAVAEFEANGISDSGAWRVQTEGEKENWREGARLALVAAIDAAFPEGDER